MVQDRTSQLQRWLDRLRAGDEEAQAEVVTHAYQRLQLLTRKMLKGFPQLRRYEDTGDVLHNVIQKRLPGALKATPPGTVRDLLQLAAWHIRRACIDRVRHYFGPMGPGANHASLADDHPRGDTHPQAEGEAGSSENPLRLAAWAEFHERIAALPNADRELWDLLYYQGLTKGETAKELGVSLTTVKRRWQDARIRLYDALGGNLPD
jgi:RNA polymerase sigma factor (sigma-70 family)